MAIASMAVYACVLLVSVLAGCNNGFSVLTESDLKYIPVSKCLVFEQTLSCAFPLPDAQVCGHQLLIFSDADASETYHRVSLDRENWIEAVSGVTTFSAIPGFAAVPCGAEFTFYMTGENLCNSIGVDVVKLGLTLAITSPASGAQVCGHNRVTFTDSDTLETAWQASVNGTSWVAFASNNTRLYQVPGFSAVACDADFTFYLRGTDGCNQTSFSLHKKGVTISVTSPSSGASVCAGNAISFSDSDVLETTHQASVDGSAWTTFTSGMTYSSISGFGTVSSPFTLYIRGNSAIDSCNVAQVANLTKIGTTITITSPLPDATVEGTDTITFNDKLPFNTYDMRINSGAWLDDAASGVTTLDEIPGFSALSTGDKFTIYVRGDDNPTCNIESVSVLKGGAVTFDGNKTILLDATGMGLSGNVIDFPVLIRLRSSEPAETAIINAVRSGAPDIRFYSATHGWLDYEIERWDQASNLAEVWVLFPLVHSGTTDQFTFYYGNATIDDGQNPEGVFSSSNGYAGVWHMGEDPSGGTIADSTDNGIDGTPGGMVAGDSITGQVGKGLNFDGTNNIVSMGTNTLLQPDSITVSFWIKRLATWDMPWVPLYAKESWSNPIGWQYYFDYNGVDSIGASLFIDGTNYIYIKQDPNTFYPNNTWVFMTLTFNTATKTGAIYKNGVPQSILTSGALSTITESLLTITKIAQDENDTVFWPGQMDELRISSVAQSADWVKLSYENQKTGQSLVMIQP